MASTTLDFPQPFGPTMQVMPVPLNVMGVFSQNDLKPNNSTLRSFSTRFLAHFAFLANLAEESSIYRSFVGGISRQKLWRDKVLQ